MVLYRRCPRAYKQCRFRPALRLCALLRANTIFFSLCQILLLLELYFCKIFVCAYEVVQALSPFFVVKNQNDKFHFLGLRRISRWTARRATTRTAVCVLTGVPGFIKKKTCFWQSGHQSFRCSVTDMQGKQQTD